MSSATPPEFFFDRSLGKITAQRLRTAGLAINLIADFYPDDARDVPDETWIAEGVSRGWVMLSKDRRIRYRAAEISVLQNGFIFCLAGGNWNIDEMSTALIAALPNIVRATSNDRFGFWHVYQDGSIRRMWP